MAVDVCVCVWVYFLCQPVCVYTNIFHRVIFYFIFVCIVGVVAYITYIHGLTHTFIYSIYVYVCVYVKILHIFARDSKCVCVTDLLLGFFFFFDFFFAAVFVIFFSFCVFLLFIIKTHNLFSFSFWLCSLNWLYCFSWAKEMIVGWLAHWLNA